MFKGIDVSKWNGSNDFNRAKADGVDFVIIRASWGGNYSSFKNNGLDPYWEENYQGAKQAGLMVGAYHYLYATSIKEAKQEAERFISQLKSKKFEYPVYLDIEDTAQKNLSKDLVTDMTVAFCKKVEEAGYYVGVYTYKNFFDTKLDKNKLKDFDKWIAHYSKSLFNSNQNYYDNGIYQMWQYGSEGNYVDGISNYGNGINYVDVNICYVDYPKIIKNTELNGYNRSNLSTPSIVEKPKNILVTYNNEIDKVFAEMIKNELYYDIDSIKNNIDYSKYNYVIHVGGGLNPKTNLYLQGQNRNETKNIVVNFINKGGLRNEN